MVGVSVVGLSIWVMYAQWGNIDKSFFEREFAAKSIFNNSNEHISASANN